MIVQGGNEPLQDMSGDIASMAEASLVPEFTVDELRIRVQDIAVLYPETALSLGALMECLGDTPPDNMVPVGASDTETPISQLIFGNSSLGMDEEAMDDVMDYIHMMRLGQLDRIYDLIVQSRPLPELFEALAILGSPCTPEPCRRPDSGALLHMQASVMHRTVTRYSLAGADDVVPAFNYDAWREFSRGSQHLDQDPPTKLKLESGASPEDDFSERKIQTLFALREPFNALLNIAGRMTGYNSETGGAVTIDGPFKINQAGYMCADTLNSDECCEDADHELAIVVDTADDRDTVLYVGQYAESFAGHARYLEEEMFFRVALMLAIAKSDDIEEFKWQFAAACISMASQRSIEVYIDPDDASLGSILEDSYALLRMNNGDEFAEGEAGFVMDIPEKLQGPIMTSNIDARSGKTMGTVEAKNRHWLFGRMVCFNPASVMEIGSEQTTDSFDLQLTMELPLTSDGPAKRYIQPFVPGFRLAGYYPVDATSEYCLQFQKVDDDPYNHEEIQISNENLQELAVSIDRIGLHSAAVALRDSAVNTLDDVWSVLENSLTYGNGRRRISVQAEEIDDLRWFVEEDQMVGVCSLFAALAVFGIKKLLPEAETRVLSGHKIKLQGISTDGHAQVMFKLPNQKTQIVDLLARGYRNTRGPSRHEAVAITAGNVLTLLSSTFLDKYQLTNTKQLVGYLARQSPDNFARQLFSLALTVAETEAAIIPPTIDLVEERLSDLQERMTHWLAAPVDVRKRLQGTFGEWSEPEVSYFADSLKQLQRSLPNI